MVTVEGVDSTHAYCVTCTRQTPMKVYPTAQPTIDPGEGYRLLKEDEKVQKGDQYYNYYNDGWKETNALDRGVVGLGWVYRRKIEQKWHCGCCSTQYEEKLNHIYPPHAEVQLKCINCKTFVNHRQKSIDKTTPPKPKLYRPWTMDEVQAGKVLRLIGEKHRTYLIVEVTPLGVYVSQHLAKSYTFKELLEDSNLEQLDGTPCGVLEGII